MERVIPVNLNLSRLVFLSEDLNLKIMIGIKHIEDARCRGQDVGKWEAIISEMKNELMMVNARIASYRDDKGFNKD